MSNILEVDNLSFGYGKEDFLKKITFEAEEGEMISVIGENGSGKTTLFKVINGILNGYSGEILYKGRDIRKIKKNILAGEIAVLYQNTSCKFPFSVFEVVAMGLYPKKGCFGKMNKEDIDFIKDIMRLTETLSLSERDIRSLSGGQAQRALLAKALVQKPRLLFLDEAMSGLDISARINMTNILYEKCKKENMTVITIQHDINMAFEKSDKIIALKNGGIYSMGKPSELLSEDFFKDVFKINTEINKDGYFRIITD